MPPVRVRIRVPATSANLGPGFDVLGLSLDLWNEAVFSVEGSGLTICIEGEGENHLPIDQNNALISAFRHYNRKRGLAEPQGLRIDCINGVPTSSGLGSSATALLMGLLAANALSGAPLNLDEMFNMAADMEGHADNVGAALYGGLVVTFRQGNGWFLHHYTPPPIQAVLVLPDINLPTYVAREALPRQITMADAIFNLGRTAMVVEAFQKGDLELLGMAMDDRLHQPYRFKLIPGSQAAYTAARQAGAAAVALSGAGPSLIAFCPPGSAAAKAVTTAMTTAFEAANISTRAFLLHTTSQGACITED